jgi:hypothetical protein
MSPTLGQLEQAMPSFDNVLDDAWLGSSIIATSDDSLVVRHLLHVIRREHEHGSGSISLDMWLSVNA